MSEQYEKKRLYVGGDDMTAIFADDGEYICSTSMTGRAKELLDNEGWDSNQESWIFYRQRTKNEREREIRKRRQFVQDIVDAYNAEHIA